MPRVGGFTRATDSDREKPSGCQSFTEARWNVVESEDKKRARINMIAHLLSSIPYEKVERTQLKLPKRPASTGYQRTDRNLQYEVPDHAAGLTKEDGAVVYVDPEDDDS